MSDSLKPFASNSLGPLQLFQRQFLLLFFLLWWRRSILSLSLLFSNIVYNFLSNFVPRPVMVIKLNQKYLELPKEAFWNLLRSQIHFQCIRRLGAGNDEIYEWRWLLLGKLFLITIALLLIFTPYRSQMRSVALSRFLTESTRSLGPQRPPSWIPSCIRILPLASLVSDWHLRAVIDIPKLTPLRCTSAPSCWESLSKASGSLCLRYFIFFYEKWNKNHVHMR